MTMESDEQSNARITNWSSAVRVALGSNGLLLFRCAFAVMLAPSVLLAAYSLHSNRFELLFPVLLSLWGFGTSSTCPTGIGIASCTLIAMFGFVLAILFQDQMLAFAGVLPGASWFGSCAILGTTASYVTDAIRASETLFQELVRRNILAATPKGEPSGEREPPMTQL